MRAHRLSALPLLFGLALPLSGLAAPELSVRLNDQPLSPSWNALAADRYDTLLELEPGRLHLVMPQAGVENTALAPFRRQPLGKDSAYRYEVPEAGRYRLIVETGASAALRLLPIKAAEPKTAVPVCQAWDGRPVNVSVGDVFRDGQTLRDALSGAMADVRDGQVTLQPAAGSDGLLLLEAAEPAKPAPRDWRNAIVYFVLTDRFANGDPGNDRSYGREPDGLDEIGTFHGGDLKGLTERLDHIASLGVDALWISAPYEQIHGWVGGGDGGDFRHYGYHGYYALDFTQLDANMGSEDDLRALISAAHARGIRVLFDVVLNHPGYSTLQDMQQMGFGALRDGMAEYLPEQWSTWQPEAHENLHAYHNLVDYEHPSWAAWWGRDWVRAGIADYDTPPSSTVDPLKGSLAFLPDFRTESEAVVALPEFLARKAQTRAEPREGYRVRDYLIEWLTLWVREYGVDGFRADTVKHVEPSTWAELRAAAERARADWARANPDDPMADEPFWMVGEVFGHGPVASDYLDQGFDALINFNFQEQAVAASDCLAAAEPSYADYARRLAETPRHNLLSYASSHDTALFNQLAKGDLTRQRGLAAALLLAPGAVQVYYGDESARAFGPTGSDPFQGTRSPMNWDEHERPEVAALIEHWQRIGRFRARHPAIGAGEHRLLSPGQPYAFARVLGEDKVIVVQAR
ncbi:alpha-amylase [Stutzerimonas kunmingensis]|uniref:alpha-amylase n=1 Tax=Stutzerimonas kunmingensis TaxID=1211807 RepID=UPI0008EDF169|nr:alpha-amylase [Stutzerimonas kunmingensis]MCQ2043951.1 alpha-amylase [Stutzerimonas kunmingensis]SFJ83600.1 alpha-amylase [Stutzerimonas kunmingensis]